jgi:flagellar biosynthesis protein FlhG
VGKTMAAANLGVFLARAGRRVLLVDLDLGLANLNVVLRLTPRFTVEDARAGRGRFADCVLVGPGGVDVLPAGSGTAAMGRDDAERFARLLAGIAELAEGYELLIGDSAAGIGPDVLAAASAADLVVLVTTPDPTALTDADGLVKALHARAEAHGLEVPTPELLVNLADGPDEAQAVAAKLRTVCERFLARSPRLAGWLAAAAAIQSACRDQRPIPQRDRNSLIQHCLRQISSRIERSSKAPGGPRAALLKG